MVVMVTDDDPAVLKSVRLWPAFQIHLTVQLKLPWLGPFRRHRRVPRRQYRAA
jgi:hypothetical protein